MTLIHSSKQVVNRFCLNFVQFSYAAQCITHHQTGITFEAVDVRPTTQTKHRRPAPGTAIPCPWGMFTRSKRGGLGLYLAWCKSLAHRFAAQKETPPAPLSAGHHAGRIAPNGTGSQVRAGLARSGGHRAAQGASIRGKASTQPTRAPAPAPAQDTAPGQGQAGTAHQRQQ